MSTTPDPAVMDGPDFGIAPVAEIEVHIARTVQSIAERGILQGGAPVTKSSGQ